MLQSDISLRLPLISLLIWGLMQASKPRFHPLLSNPGGPPPCQSGSEEEEWVARYANTSLSTLCIQHAHSMKVHTHKLT